jgi:hypothetical protein
MSFVVLFDCRNFNFLKDISNPIFSFESDKPEDDSFKSLRRVEPNFIKFKALGLIFTNVIEKFDYQWNKERCNHFYKAATCFFKHTLWKFDIDHFITLIDQSLFGYLDRSLSGRRYRKALLLDHDTNPGLAFVLLNLLEHFVVEREGRDRRIFKMHGWSDLGLKDFDAVIH